MSPHPPASDPGDGSGLHEETVLHRDGSLRARGTRLGDELHGHWEWYRLDGSRLRSGSFDHGRQVGEWTTFDAGGAPHRVTRFPAPDGDREEAHGEAPGESKNPA